MTKAKQADTAVALRSALAIEVDGKVYEIERDAVSLIFKDPLPWEVYVEAARELGDRNRTVLFYIGDLLNHGEAVFGQASAQVVDDPASRYDVVARGLGMEPQTVMNVQKICEKVARGRRREELGFWIHGEVAALTPDEQTHWLNEAVEHLWGRADLRAAIREAKAPGDDDDPPPAVPKVTPCERFEQVLRLAWNQGQSTSDGSALIPAETWTQMGVALGEIES